MNRERLTKLRRMMKCPMVIFGSNVRYFTEVADLSGTLLVTKDTEFLISSDKDLAETAGVANFIKPKRKTSEELFETLKNEKIKKIGIDLDSLSYNIHKKLQSKVKIVDAGKILKEMRQVKDAEEIKSIKKSCTLADKAMSIAADSLKKDTTERKIRTDILQILGECEAQSFDFIVASGPNSMYTHSHPTTRRIKENDLVIIDIGFKVDGYCSDLTRTFCLEPTKEQKHLHSFVSEAREIAFNNIKVNTKCKVTCQKVETFFKKHNMCNYWKYGLGHGIGLDIHESPSLSLDSEDKFKLSMVFTIEPGLHVPGTGGVRIEDDILMTKKGPQPLTKFPRRLVP